MPNRYVYFDLEGTGPDAYYDRVVEMAFHDGTDFLLNVRVNPGRPIPPETTAVHGISDADVVGCPPFSDYAARVQSIVDGAVLVGYNLIRYDTILIDRELRMAGERGLDRDSDGVIVHPEVDLFGIWNRLEPRKLATAAKRFGGYDLADAHAAGADTECLPAILDGLLEAFDLAGDVEELAGLSRPEGAVDRDGKFVRRDDGVVVFNFAKVRGQPVHSDEGFLRWMLGKDFSPETLRYVREFLEEMYATDPPDGRFL